MKSIIRSTICTHPEGIKPLCRCGQNAACPICGFGYGALPCQCDRVNEITQKYKEQFQEAWEKLAK